MVLPEKLFGVGLTLRSLLSPDGLGPPNHGLQSRGVDNHGFSTTELARFSNTLKVARDIVEEQKRSDVVEVPITGLVSILDRIKALEDEVEALINGKNINTDSKMIESSPVDESESTAAALTSDADAASTALPSNPTSSPSDESPGYSSAKGSPEKDSPTSQTGAASPDGSGDGKDDCGPEHLIYRLGGGSLQRRSMTVSEHPLFRRSTNCNLASVAGGKKAKELPSGAAVFKEGDASAAGSADKSGSTAAAPSTDSDATEEPSTKKPAGDTAVYISTSMSGSASPEAAVAKLDGLAPTVTMPSAATDLGSKASANPSEIETDDQTTTTTLTSTIYKTRTIHLRPATTKASANAKFVNSTQAMNSTGPAVKNGTAATPVTLPEQSLLPLRNVTASDPKAVAMDPLAGKPLFQKMPSRLELESLTASASDTETNVAAVQPLSKNETTTEVSTPILTVEIGAASTADTVTTGLSQASLVKNMTTSSLETDTTAVTISVVHLAENGTSAMPTDDLGTPMQSFSTFISPHSTAAARERLSDPGSSATTVHGSSIAGLTPTFTDSPASTASGSSTSAASAPELPSDMTSSPLSSAKEPQTEATTSNMSRVGFQNRTSDRPSGFKTVTIPRSMSAIAGLH
ncbi:hypothetical protein NQ176_g7029 [Zarea fungicola]|uniref:Uncharacterized protein n=1 Tax=Zarea fungicola TaxID=93591 RepID=A0ACC1N2J8_9HYPO|nr:hypothetical protein NQ176_g7029 [Lecanicillium fungicola]